MVCTGMFLNSSWNMGLRDPSQGGDVRRTPGRKLIAKKLFQLAFRFKASRLQTAIEPRLQLSWTPRSVLWLSQEQSAWRKALFTAISKHRGIGHRTNDLSGMGSPMAVLGCGLLPLAVVGERWRSGYSTRGSVTDATRIRMPTI